MLKRFLAFMCLLAVCIGCICLGAMATGYKDATVAVIGAEEFVSLQAAVTAYKENNVIQLVKNETAAATITKDVYLDLNGFTVSGAVTVGTDATLYCKDSATDDFDVAGNAYGKLTNVSGNVEGIPEESALTEDGYLKITEGKEVSFHRVDLKLTSVVLRAVDQGVCAPGAYYKSNFKGDQKVAEAVKGYGIALSINAMPDAQNLESDCKRSRFTQFASGADGNSVNGTYLSGIMKPSNKALINLRNSNVPIYGRAYIEIESGFVFGSGRVRTLKQISEAADARWASYEDEPKKNMSQMYVTYSSIMKSWELPNLREYTDPTKDGALKVLVIGNSHGLDATNFLYEVFEDQGYDEQKVVLGALYKAGCTMREHADYMTNSKPNYEYYENDGSNPDGTWDAVIGTVADTALYAHQWDIIVLQQMNNWAANPNSYARQEWLTVIEYVKSHQIGKPRLGFHMVWTNPDGVEYVTAGTGVSCSDNEGWVRNHVTNFPSATDPTKYDQNVMYQKMVRCMQTFIEDDENFLRGSYFDFVIPSCTVTEYAQDVLGLSQAEIYRDYTHMNDYGRLMVSYLWYAKILGLEKLDSVGISKIPEALHYHSNQHASSEYPALPDLEITPKMQQDILTAVNYALEHPYELP